MVVQRRRQEQRGQGRSQELRHQEEDRLDGALPAAGEQAERERGIELRSGDAAVDRGQGRRREPVRQGDARPAEPAAGQRVHAHRSRAGEDEGEGADELGQDRPDVARHRARY